MKEASMMAQLLLLKLYMKTNALKIVNLLVQQSGGLASDSRKLKNPLETPGARSSAESRELTSRESDNTRTSDKNTTKFKESLHEKMSLVTPDNKDGIGKKKKDSSVSPDTDLAILVQQGNIDAKAAIPATTDITKVISTKTVPTEAIPTKAGPAETATKNSDSPLSNIDAIELPETIMKSKLAVLIQKANPNATENVANNNPVSKPEQQQFSPSSIPLTKVAQQAIEHGMQTRTAAHEAITMAVPRDKESGPIVQPIQEFPSAETETLDRVAQETKPSAANPGPVSRFEHLNNVQTAPARQETTKMKSVIKPNIDFSGITSEKLSQQPETQVAAQKENSTKTAQTLPVTNDDDVRTKTIAAQTVVHKMNLSAEQIHQLQTEKSGNLVDRQAIESEFKSDNSTSQTSQGSLASNQQTVSAPDVSKPSFLPQSETALDRQIHENIRSSYQPGTRQILIRLEPSGLGRITINFTENRDGITGVLHVEQSHTKEQIQHLLPGIIQNLQNSDIPVKKLEVALTQQQFNTSADHSGDHYAAFEQHSSDSRTSASPGTGWQTNLENAHDIVDSQIYVTDKSINILM